MKIDGHIITLKKKHAHLDLEIIKRKNTPAPDNSQLNALKRQKLKIKDTLNRYDQNFTQK